jgi:1-acyl-sn-glycerol-3-phosphate acyltransferase
MMKAVVTVGTMGLAMVPLGGAAAVMGALRFKRPPIDWCYRSFCALGLKMCNGHLVGPVLKTPRELLPPQAVIVSNHESHLDAAAITVALHPRSIRFVAKRELFDIPFFGWGLRWSGNIPVERNRSSGDVSRLHQAARHRTEGDVLFFAEGTRSPDGAMHEFKKGAFIYAIEKQQPILPVGVGGGFEVLPARELAGRHGPVAVVVGEPISVAGLTLDDRDALRDRVRETITHLRAEALELAGSPRARTQCGPG